VAPTLFADVTPNMRIAREEIFGPVLVVMAHDGDEDAIRLANDTPYGLSGAVFSRDDARALRVARRVKAGQIHVNGAAFNPSAPFGGMKQSGIGREYGLAGLLEFTELKSIQT
jgi:aldehyde dehydrogenase (NAD+)